MSLLKAEKLVKIYGTRRVVNNVHFEMEPGEIVGLLGRNGAGKTTSFRITVGMIKANEGSVTLNGEEVTNLPMYQRARLGMGYLPQEASIFQKMTVEGNLMAILETLRLTRREQKNRCTQLLEEFRLSYLRGQKASTLSGGERRRLELARALVPSPTLLMLDEPFSGVDPIAVEGIKEIILELKSKGMGLLLTDHNVRDSLSVTNRSYIIEEGKILREGTSEELVNNQLVRSTYLGENFSM